MAAEEGELELSCKVLGNAPLTTRERIRRDRELHRLGLNLVERIPKDVLIDLVQVNSGSSLPRPMGQSMEESWLTCMLVFQIIPDVADIRILATVPYSQTQTHSHTCKHPQTPHSS